jgi:hypothetical protein
MSKGLGRVACLAFWVPMISCGCTHLQLQQNALDQMQTVHDIHQQQVLDNLAMFVCNPSAFPYFSIASQGSSAVANQAALTVANQWQRTLGVFSFFQLVATPTANHSVNENWTLNPVNDSVKLSLMRCAYQRALGSCIGISPSCIDPNCNQLFETFYPAQRSMRLPLDDDCTTRCRITWGASTEPTNPPVSRGLPHVSGIVTPSALTDRGCWFCWGPKSRVPQRLDPSFVGHYRNTYLWVPKKGREELTKLTLLILDIAYYDPSAPPPARTVDITVKPGSTASAEGEKHGATGNSEPTVEQKATVPLGTTVEAVKLAPQVFALKRLLAEHGLTVDGLIDYWARDVAGPGMTCDDVESIRSRLNDLGVKPRQVPQVPCRGAVQQRLLEVSHSRFGEGLSEEQLSERQLDALARLWSKGRWRSDGLSNFKERLDILDSYRMASDCNPFAKLGTEVVDRIAYGFLAAIPVENASDWRKIRERLHDLDIPKGEAARSASPVPYAGILGAAINLQNATPAPQAIVPVR